MMMSDLPADLVEEILSRVPAKSLKRLRSTCKHWNSLFKNRVFTENHFRKAAKQSMVLLLKNYRVCLMSVNLNVVAPSIEFKGELSLEHSHSSSEKVDIISVFHCDGLLLCTTKDNELVVWNPCLKETRWIQHKSYNKKLKCALGYQNNNSCRSYKILSCWKNDNYVVGFEIYEFSSGSWRVFDNNYMDYSLINPTSGVSLKGNTYWLTLGYSTFLLSFDFTEERFKRMYLPPNLTFYTKEVLSIVREEQLSLLIPNYKTLKMEIWMTKNIDTEATLSWWKSFTVDIQNYNTWSAPVCYGFLIDEEKRVVVCSNGTSYGYIVDIIGEDDEYKTKLPFEASRNCSPFIFNYAPSLVQIQREKNRRSLGNDFF